MPHRRNHAELGSRIHPRRGERELLKLLQRDFATVKHAKPAASRQDSAESYVGRDGV